MAQQGPPSSSSSGVTAHDALARDAVITHADVRRLAEVLAVRPGAQVPADEGAPRRAAVALILRVTADETVDLLFIQRAEYAGDPWSGHVAFPGGRAEPSDHSLEDTAVRETREETAIDVRRDGRVLGALDEIRPLNPALPQIVVRPYVALVPPDVAITLSDEVAAAFWVPLTRLRDPVSSGESGVLVRGEERQVSSYRYEGHVIWGLTERILRQLLGFLD